MTDDPLALMAVLAHPDDEVWLGHSLAKYSDQGVRTILVTATRGEEGEIRDPDLDPEEARKRLSQIREDELRRAVRILGISQLYFLEYRDSGMVGTPANDNYENFHNADPDEATGRLVALIRRERPQVIICDNERGTYGHPDHIAGHRTTLAAFDAAGDSTRYPDIGPAPWQPSKLYYAAFARSDFTRMRDLILERGIEWGTEEEMEGMLEMTVPDEQVTTRVDVAGYDGRVREAMRAHRTQIPPDDPWLNMPDELAAQWSQGDAFVLARSQVETTLPEDDLFAGVCVQR